MLTKQKRLGSVETVNANGTETFFVRYCNCFQRATVTVPNEAHLSAVQVALMVTVPYEAHFFAVQVTVMVTVPYEASLSAVQVSFVSFLFVDYLMAPLSVAAPE